MEGKAYKCLPSIFMCLSQRYCVEMRVGYIKKSMKELTCLREDRYEKYEALHLSY